MREKWIYILKLFQTHYEELKIKHTMMNYRSTIIFFISLTFSQSCVTPKLQKSEKIQVKEKNKDKPVLIKQESNTRETNNLDLSENDKEINQDDTLSENDMLSNIYNDKIDEVYIYQNGEERLIKGEIKLTKSKFSIRFYNYAYLDKSRYNARLRVTQYKRDFKKIKIGAITNDLSNVPFSDGWGIAAPSTGYERLWFMENGFHYLIYKNEVDRRLTLVDKVDEWLKLDFEINNFTIDKGGSLNIIEDILIDQFYLAIYIDRNLNNTIDKGELFKCKVVFR
jgi:hypothetical protein